MNGDQASSVRLGLGLYRICLRLLPRDFRDAFGPDMLQLLKDRLAEGDEPRGRPEDRPGNGPVLQDRIHRGQMANRIPSRSPNRARVLTGAFLDLASSIVQEHLTRLRHRPPQPRRNGPRRRTETGIQTLLADLRQPFRLLRKNPGHAVGSALTLGLGIGATTLAFSLVNGVLLRPLPFPDPEDLVYLMEEGGRGQELMLSYPNFDDLRTASSAFRDIAAVQFANVASAWAGGEPTRATILSVSREFFRVMGIAPIRGRPILPDENRPGGDRVVVTSYAFWTSALGARDDLDALTLNLYGGTWQVVGVMPPGFEVLEEADVYIPMELNPVRIRDAHNYRGIGRLASGVSLDQARTEMDRIAATIKATYGDDTSAEAVAMRPLRDAVVGEADAPLLLLLAAAGVLLLIACTNQASNLLARGTHRRPEMAIRSALGASRGRLVRQLLLEGGLLATLGCLVGLAVTFGTLHGLRLLGPDRIPRLEGASVDLRVLLFAVLVTVATALLFGLKPAFRATEDISGSLASAGHRGSTSARGLGWNLLVAFEVAMAVVLVTGCGLLVRSLQEIVGADAGYQATGIMTATVDLSGQGFDTEETRAAVIRDLNRELSRIPEVAKVGIVNRLPLQADTWTGPVLRSPVTDRENREEWVAIAGWRVTDEDYFTAMGIPILAGRTFDPALDRAESPPVAVLNRSLAEKAFPGEDPVGRKIQALWDQREEDFTVVGVVAEARDWRRAPGSQPELFVYWPQRLEHTGSMTAVLRPREGQAIPATEVRNAVRTAASSMPVEVRAMESFIGESLRERQFALSVLGSFALAALLLSAMGIYGVVSYTVSRRTRELGIRLALGAQPRLLRRHMFQGSMGVVAVGAALGLGTSLLAGRAMAGLLFGITPRDPSAITTAPLILLATAALAVWIPVLRYTRVDPVQAMEVE